MPNDNTAVCGCGVVLDLPKSRQSNNMQSRSYTILRTNGKSSGTGNKMEGRPAMKKPSELANGNRNGSRVSDMMGSTSSVAESTGSGRTGGRRKDKRTNSSRRTRSAERAESHYTYIDSGSSYVSLRENAITENLYCTIDDDLLPSNNHQTTNTTTTTPSGTASSPGQGNSSSTTSQNNRQLYAVPSMTSPPPTYDVAIAKTWQTGLPPSYEEYLFHKRSHTPPPPWTDSPMGGSAGTASLDLRTASAISQELLANQPELREYLTQLALQGGAEAALHHYQQLLLQQQALRKQAARVQRSRAMPPRSQSESRAQQQQRIAYEDGAFCMETTAIQSAFENGVAFCSLM